MREGKELKRTRMIRMKTKRNGAHCIERKGDCDERKSIEVKEKNCTERSRNRSRRLRTLKSKLEREKKKTPEPAGESKSDEEKEMRGEQERQQHWNNERWRAAAWMGRLCGGWNAWSRGIRNNHD